MCAFLHLGNWNIDFLFIHLHGPIMLGTFGIMLWLAAVTGIIVLQLNFQRYHINADALTIVAVATVAGVVGARVWHVLETPHWLMMYPAEELLSRAGFAWYGGLIAGILVLLWQGHQSVDGQRIGMLRMLDLSAPATAIGYGVGRIGCLLSGDGDYGIATKLPWGVDFSHPCLATPMPGILQHCALDPTAPGILSQPTPVYEFLFAVALAWWLWRRGDPKRGGKSRPIGALTGEYLIISGVARFLVEFIRRNPKIFLQLTNAQLASIGAVIGGAVLVIWVMRKNKTVKNKSAAMQAAQA
jgi:phosphatidylglycerol:prolipoprotein diacylglycerol transferase